VRHSAIALILAILAAGAFGQGSSKSQISQLPDGTLSGDTYTNDAVGVSYEFPNGWTATADVKGPTRIDVRHPRALANQCSKVLLSLNAPGKVSGRFSSFAILLAIDPACLSGPPFPQSVSESEKIKKVAQKIAKAFSDTPYVSPFGNTVHPFDSQGRLTIRLTAAVIINAIEGEPAPRKEPLRVQTSFTFTELNGYWVAWAFIADDNSAAELQSVKVVFKNPSTQ